MAIFLFILQILGGVFLFMLLAMICIFALLCVGGYRSETLMILHEALSTPPDVQLQPVDKVACEEQAQFDALAEKIRDAGGQHIANYEIASTENSAVSAFSIADNSAYAIVYCVPPESCWIDIVAFIDDDRSYTASTLPEVGKGAPRHPDHPITCFHPESLVQRLVADVIEYAPQRKELSQEPAEFEKLFRIALDATQ